MTLFTNVVYKAESSAHMLSQYIIIRMGLNQTIIVHSAQLLINNVSRGMHIRQTLLELFVIIFETVKLISTPK